jgi:PAS domain-containing protein
MAVPAALIEVARWLAALAAPAVAFGIGYVLFPLTGRIPAPPFMAAILFVAWMSGLRPALLALVLSLATLNYFFIPPLHAWVLTPGDGLWLLVFSAVAIAASWLIDSRARLRARLLAGEQQLRLITDAAPTLICYVDTDRRYRFVNRAYAAQVGRSREELVGRRVPEVLGAAA